MAIQRINPDSLPTPPAAYSQVVKAGTTITIAGMIAVDSDGNTVGEGDIAAQTKQALENMKACLEATGSSMENVIQATVFLTDFANYTGYNAVFGEYFKDHPPARATVCAALAKPEWLVEIMGIAVVDES